MVQYFYTNPASQPESVYFGVENKPYLFLIIHSFNLQ